MISIQRYTPEHKRLWDEFVAKSKNATFLHFRDYMDYHADRFTDHSLMAFDAKGNVLALLPANIDGDTLHSHQGLTYGGWLTPIKHFNASTMLELFDATIQTLKKNGIRMLVYKAIPYIYHRYPADEDLYALFRHGAQQTECDISITCVNGSPLNKYSKGTKLNIAKARQNGIEIAESQDFESFWKILETHLKARHNATPVHSLQEMRLLHERFPNNIRLFSAFRNGNLVAGCVYYVTDTVEQSDRSDEIVGRIVRSGIPAVVVINKIDLTTPEALEAIVDRWHAKMPDAEIVPVSAKERFNMKGLLEAVLRRLPEGEPFYPKDTLTDRPMRFFASEIIREKIMLNYDKEIPYCCQIEIDTYKEEPAIDRISATIYVARNSQKGIVIGHKGEKLKRVGRAAREDLERFLGKKVFLQLFVKVQEGWRDNERQLQRFGYDPQ